MRQLLDWEKDCVIEIKEFLECCRTGGFIDYDGFGHPMIDGLVDDSLDIFPSNRLAVPPGTTHIVWYNK